jgi:tetratricopeptide (TPR) repeat protein
MGSSERIAATLLMLVIATAMAGCKSSHERFESYLAHGRQLLAKGNLEKAGIEFRNALQIEPRSVDALYLNGRVAERRGSIREAVDYYQAALDVQPADDRARACLAKMYVLGGATQRALELITPGLLDHPDDPDLLAARAAALHQLDDDGEARVDAERAVRIAPTNENAIAVLAALALRSGEKARAISLVNDAVVKSPDSIDLRRVLAGVYLAAGEPRLAEEQMRKLIAMEPGELPPRLQLANHFVQVEDLDAAQRVLDDAVRELPHQDSAKLALVDFITAQRSRAQGEKTLAAFIADDPGNEELRLAMGTLLQHTGATREAINVYQEIIRRDGLRPQGLAARDRIAALELDRHNTDAAAKLIAEVLEESPRDDDALILRANISMARNDPTAAIIDFRAVLRDQPKSAVLQRSLARAYLAKGQPALAEQTLRGAVTAVPEDIAVRADLAQVLMQTGRPAQAASLLEETVNIAPKDPSLRETLVRAYIADHDLSEARTAVEELQRLRPNASEGYHLAGVIAYDQRRFDDSDRNLARALELQPGSVDILTTLTRFGLERGHASAVVDRLRRTLQRDPNNVEILSLLGDTYLQIKDLAHASETFHEVVTLNPRSWLAYRGLAQVRLAANDPNGAIDEYQAALRIAPGQPRLTAELAALYERQGRIDEAIASYEQLLQSDADSQQLAANNLAMLLVTHRSDQASLDRARSLTARFDLANNASLLDTTGWVRFKRREYRDAVAVLERAADHAPDSKAIQSHLQLARAAAAKAARAVPPPASAALTVPPAARAQPATAATAERAQPHL